MYLGSHMSIAGGIEKSVERGLETGCEAFQIFVKSNNQWKARPFHEGEPEAFREALAASGIKEVIAHNCYLVNMASPKPDLREKSIEATRIELERCSALGVPRLIIHPGSHMKDGEAVGIERLAKSLDKLEDDFPEVKILLETTAGQGTNLGWKFEHLRDIIAGVRNDTRLGVCLDTCHVFAAGYDVRTEEGYEEMMQEIETKVGMNRFEAVHVNDSKTPFGSRVDRHAHIGEGEIGLDGFRLFVNDPRWKGRPFVLETAKGPEMEEDRENLRRLRSLVRTKKTSRRKR